MGQRGSHDADLEDFESAHGEYDAVFQAHAQRQGPDRAEEKKRKENGGNKSIPKKVKGWVKKVKRKVKGKDQAKKKGKASGDLGQGVAVYVNQE